MTLDYRYNLIYRDAFGNRLQSFRGFNRLDYTIKENEVGVCSLTLADNYDLSLFQKDRILEINRTIGDTTSLVGDKFWYLVYWEAQTTRRGERIYNLIFHDTNDLLQRREVNYYSGDDEASKTDFADDMMKAIVRENLGVLATDTTRDISDYLAVQADSSLAPVISKAFSRRGVLDTLQEIAEDSLESGTYLVFDTVKSDAGVSEFRTYIGQRGTDQGNDSANKRVVSERRGNLVRPQLIFDWRDVSNSVTAGGQGQGNDRIIQTVSDQDSIDISPVNLLELFVDARNADLPATVLAEANYALEKNRFRTVLTGEIQDTESFRFGIEYDFGDIVVAEHKGLSFDVHVDTISVKVSDGEENIDAKIRGELIT